MPSTLLLRSNIHRYKINIKFVTNTTVVSLTRGEKKNEYVDKKNNPYLQFCGFGNKL